MKVLVVHNAYQSKTIGGEDLVVQRELAGLRTLLGTNRVFSYIKSNDQIKPHQLMKTLWGDTQHADAVFDMIQKNQIDIVHVHNFFPLLTPLVFEAAKKAGAHVVHSLHNFRWWCPAGTLYRENHGACHDCINKLIKIPAVLHGCYRGSRAQSLVASMAFYWYHLKRYQKAIDAYFVLSDFQKKLLASFGLTQALWLKPNPVLVPTCHIETQQKKDYLTVGRLESAKGIDKLLATWSDLPASFVLHVVGDGPQKPDLVKQYARKNIIFHGNLSHETVLKHMAKARYFIHSGLAYETFGLTLIEAFSQGTPVIGLDIGTRTEFISHEENGYLCDLATLRDTIIASDANTDYAAMSQAAFNAAKPFWLPNIMQKQIEIYESLLKGETT